MFQDELQINCPLLGPLPFVPCPDEEVSPLVEHLMANLPVMEATEFPRGTMLPDGRLDLCKQNLGPTGCRRVVQALQRNDHVRSLLLGADGIGDEGASSLGELLQENPKLEIVYLGCNGITATGARSLAESLVENSNVKGLWLKRNPIGDQGVEAITKLLAKNRSLRVLDLVNTGIGRRAIALLCQTLKDVDCSIERLYLGGNSLDEIDAIEIADVIRSNRRIKCLLLNVGRLGDEGAIAIAAALQANDTLCELGLASNGITFRGGEAIFSAVTRHPSLRHLDLGYSPSTRVLQAYPNTLGDEGGACVAKMLAGNSALTSLNLSRSGILQRGRDAIEAALLGNGSIHRCTIDRGLSDKAQAQLRNNQANAAQVDQPSRDVTLIRSIYRSTK